MNATAKELSDEALLLAARDEPEAFALFYRRHVRASTTARLAMR